jgi:hypothetical protein
LSAILLGGLAGFLAVYHPIPIAALGFVPVPLSGVALVLGLLALVSRPPGGIYLALPLLGVAVSLPAVVMAFWMWGSWSDASNEKQVFLGNPGVAAQRRAERTDWVDANLHELKQGDVRVRVMDVAVRSVELKDAAGTTPTPEKYLVIRLRVTNAAPSRKLEYVSWGEPGTGGTKALVRVQDQRGKEYAAKSFGAETEVMGHVRKGSIPAGKSLEDVLVFEAAAADVEFLRVELSTTAFHQPGRLRAQVPRPMIHFQ